MRQKFTTEWKLLPSAVKSVIISIGAFFLGTALLMFSKWAFPTYDFSEVEQRLITAFSGFMTFLIIKGIQN